MSKIIKVLSCPKNGAKTHLTQISLPHLRHFVHLKIGCQNEFIKIALFLHNTEQDVKRTTKLKSVLS